MKLIRNVMIIAVIFVMLSIGVGLMLFRTQHTARLERTIVTKVRQETPYLANFEAMYNLAFTNSRDRWVVSDDFYIREDKAKVFYGYPLRNVQIDIAEGNILRVRLPQPQQISIDRGTIFKDVSRDDYEPLDDDKQTIDVDKLLKQRLDEVIATYESKTLEATRKLSHDYFDSLAHRFGLQLELEFVE